MAKVFGNVPDVLAGLVQQQASPQNALVMERIRQMKQDEIRRNMFRQYLSTADPKDLTGSGMAFNIMKFFGDPQFVQEYARSKLAEDELTRSLSAKSVLGQSITKAFEDRVVTPEEQGRMVAEQAQLGGDVAETARATAGMVSVPPEAPEFNNALFGELASQVSSGERSAADARNIFRQETGRDVVFTPEAKTPTPGTEAFTQTTKLRGEFLKQSDKFISQRDWYGQVQTAATTTNEKGQATAAGDLALIFSYMKMLDPTSVVREGEQATAENARAVPEGIRARYNKLIVTGAKLGVDQRKDFVRSAKRLYEDLSKQHEQRKSTYTGLAKRSGLNPKDVVVELSIAPERLPQPEDEVQTITKPPLGQTLDPNDPSIDANIDEVLDFYGFGR